MSDLGEIEKGLQKDRARLDRLNPKAMPELRNPLNKIAEGNLASAFYDCLAERISEFESSLDEAHEVGLWLVNFGQTVILHLSDMDYWNPSLIVFKGVMDDGSSVELIQHVSQISVLLMKSPRKDPSKPKQRIGFRNQSK